MCPHKNGSCHIDPIMLYMSKVAILVSEKLKIATISQFACMFPLNFISANGTLITDRRAACPLFFRAVSLVCLRQHASPEWRQNRHSPGQDNGSELKFLVVSEQSCHSGCHLKQRWQTRQWWTAPIALHKPSTVTQKGRRCNLNWTGQRRRHTDVISTTPMCILWKLLLQRGAVDVAGYNWDEKGTRLKFLLVSGVRWKRLRFLMSTINFNFKIVFHLHGGVVALTRCPFETLIRMQNVFHIALST